MCFKGKKYVQGTKYKLKHLFIGQLLEGNINYSLLSLLDVGDFKELKPIKMSPQRCISQAEVLTAVIKCPIRLLIILIRYFLVYLKILPILQMFHQSKVHVRLLLFTIA